jgi:hypothetical protein
MTYICVDSSFMVTGEFFEGDPARPLRRRHDRRKGMCDFFATAKAIEL